MAERRRHRAPSEQARPLRALLVVWAVAVVVLVVVATQQEASQRALLLDPVATGRLPWYTGIVASLAELCLAAAATVSAGTAVLAHVGGRPGAVRLFAMGAVAGVVLLVDDLVTLHVLLVPVLGVPKLAVEALVGASVAAWILANLAELRRTRVPLLAAALASLGASVGIDALQRSSTLALLAEDGAKLLGVSAWATFFAMTGYDVAVSVVRNGGRAPAPAPTGERAVPAK